MAKKNTKQSIKDKVKAKAKQVKDKVKGKKSACKGCTIGAALALLLCAAGCMDTAPASRATSNEIGDVKSPVEVVLKNSCSNTVNVTVSTTFGDGALASADSAGSTETQTATPTLSIPVRIDARYNDMLAQASDATKATLSSIGGGLGAVLDMMMSGKSGKVQVTKSDGTPATVQCEGGQCEYVPGE